MTTHSLVRSTTLAFMASVLSTSRLLIGRRLRTPGTNVDRRVVFADGTSFRVFRETVRAAPCRDPSVLVVRFRLRLVGRSRLGHALFRGESIANTPLFAGFPGFRTKLWLSDAVTGEYRGLYDWDGAERARRYASTLMALLTPVCVPGSVAFHVEPETTRDVYLQADAAVPGGEDERWWKPAQRERA